MTTKRIYSCNFCKQEEDRVNMYGLRWIVHNDLEVFEVSQCESHLCKNCLRAITQIGNETKEKEKEKENET